MKPNESQIDRVIRVGIAVVAVVVAIFVGPASVVGIVLFVVAAVMLVTAAVGFCPLYRVFGISTCSVESKEAPTPEPAAHA